MRDSEIEQWVLNEVRLMTGSRFKELGVWSSNGVVTLKGTVQSRADKLSAQQAAERAKGVVAVSNQLRLRRRNAPRRRASVESPVVSTSATFHLPHQPATSPHVAN